MRLKCVVHHGSPVISQTCNQKAGRRMIDICLFSLPTTTATVGPWCFVVVKLPRWLHPDIKTEHVRIGAMVAVHTSGILE
jgi:hypothetical protein